MKIAHVVCVFPPYKGGMGQSAYDYYKSLSKSGLDVEVLTPDYNRKYKNDDSKIIRLFTFLKLGNGAFVPGLFFKLKKYDIVHLHYPFFGGSELVCFASLFFKFKLVLHFHMDALSLSPMAKLLSLPSKLLSKRLFKKADILICSSQDYIENSSIEKLYKKYKQKFSEIPFGVDLGFFKAKHRENIGKIIFVGALDKAHNFKGLDNLLDALAQINQAEWSLKVVGDGNMKNFYIEKAKQLNLTNKIEFLGRVDDDGLRQAYRDSSFIILPSINSHEAFGIVLIEAMACGLAVIASDLPGVRTVFIEGINGEKVLPGNIPSLKENIENFLNNPKIVAKYGKESRKLAEMKYDKEKNLKKLIACYKEL